MNCGATRVVTLDDQAPTHGSDPVSESAKTPAYREISATHTVVGDLDDGES